MSRSRRYNKTVYVFRGTASRATSGTVTLPLAASAEATTYKGKLFPGHGAVSDGNGLAYEADARLHVDASADIRPEGHDSSSDGKADILRIDSLYYEVISVIDPGERGSHKEVLLKRYS
ncbi:MAG TPA: hypothetical protein VM487_20050 [Phycisphaerae bacterium]|nr:hypothetical protein [Phycisphaerae bacterium]